MRVFAAGATGFVGRYLVEALLRHGHQVTLLQHRANPTPGVATVTGDIREPAGWASALSGHEAVINLVGIIREFPERGITYRAMHVLATENIIRATREAGIERYLHMSALGTGPNAVSEYFRTKYEAELRVKESGLRYTIFRPSLMFGAGAGFFETLESLTRMPIRPVIGSGKTRFQPVSVLNVAEVYARALTEPKAEGQIYEIGGPKVYTFEELLRLLAEAGGRGGRPSVHLPLGLLKAVVPWAEKFSAFPLTEDQLKMLQVDNITSDRRWQEDFHLTPDPLEDWLLQKSRSR